MGFYIFENLVGQVYFARKYLSELKYFICLYESQSFFFIFQKLFKQQNKERFLYLRHEKINPQIFHIS